VWVQSYRGCALGKGQQSAKTEIEKYKLFDMTCREAMKYVAKMCVTDDSADATGAGRADGF
jgi:20S proteasome subunit alpha 7